MAGVVKVPSSNNYALLNACVPVGVLEGEEYDWDRGLDCLTLVDIEVKDGKLAALKPAGQALRRKRLRQLDLNGKMVLPTFADLHTHIGERCICLFACLLQLLGACPLPPAVAVEVSHEALTSVWLMQAF